MKRHIQCRKQPLNKSEAAYKSWLNQRLLISQNQEHKEIMSNDKAQAIEAAVYRRLIEHLRARPGVQNIDLMNLADFCRNCLSKWYVAAAKEQGVSIDYEQARALVYGMPYAEWKDKYQTQATPEQLARFNADKK